MLKQYDPQTARQTILKRTPPDEFPVSPRLLDGIAQLFGERLTPDEAVSRILKDVRINGDLASAKMDTTPRWLGPQAGSRSKSIDPICIGFRFPRPDATRSKSRIANRSFHRHQPLTSWFTNELGGTLGQIIRPIQRVGFYVPGGTAPLPSSVLMSAIPARVAGVKDIVVVTPPSRSLKNTKLPVPPIILAACAIAKVDEIYLLGGCTGHWCIGIWNRKHSSA